MMIRHVLLKRKNNIGSVVDIVSVWKVLSVFCLAFVLLIGCGEPNLDDPKVREKIIAEAIDFDSLQTRRAPSGEELRYAPNQEQPYTGWVKSGSTLQQFQNGKPHGIYISWYSNQQNAEKGTFRNGQKNGLWTWWYENGQKLGEGAYKNSIQDGMWPYWDENGQRYLEINYTNIDILFAQLNEPKVREKIITEAIHVNSLRENRSKTSSEKLVYAPNKEQPYTGWVEFNNWGQQTRAFVQCQNGKIHGLFISWYSSNQQNAQQILTYNNGKVDGLSIRWHENGQQSNEDTYKNGEPDGLQVAWYENGQQSIKRTYKNGEWDGLWTAWYENGQKKSEETWKNGKEDGVWIEWDKNGQEVSRETFKDGIGEYDNTLTPLKEETEESPQTEAEDTSEEK